jgi:thiol-disulfide isomerase/thioredoxin
MYNVDKLKRSSEPIMTYLEGAKAKTDRFNERFYGYKLDHETVEKMRKHAKKAVAFVFSAEWCPDCYRNVPVLALISEATGLEVRVFGHLMRDSKSNVKRWAVPPSPKEVEEFKVAKIPYIIVLNMKGEKLGEIVENPRPGLTLEEELLGILTGPAG